MIERDITIIGGGPGGYVAAIHAARLGAKVSLVEKDTLGGTCLNRGCIPTKTLITSAEMLRKARTADGFGINIGELKLNFPKMMERKNSVVQKLVSGIEQLMKANRISVHKGHAHIASPHMVKVNDEGIETGKIIIATGSELYLPPIPGSDLPGVITTDEILELKELPASLAVIGGGYVGVEFATIFNMLGTKVTILEQLPCLLPTIDEEISRRFTRALSPQGIDIKTGVSVTAIEAAGRELKVILDTPEGQPEITGQMALMATGRTPCTGELGLSELGIKINKHSVMVNEHLETSVPGIYAIGDVLGKNMLAHTASYEGEVAVDNALGHPRKADYRAVPGCIYTQPEIASVGITEREAKEQGIPCKTSKFPFQANSRAVTLGETAGLVKMICRAEDGRVIGLHIMGTHASDLIAEGALAIKMGATAEDIADTIHAHPTLSEAMREAALGQITGAIHFHNRQEFQR